jgi:hypothetical protein
MAQPPWKDALVRASRSAAAPAAPPPLERVAAAAPGLQHLLDERRALEQRMQGLTGGAAGDPRYAVEPLDQRRAALAAWSQSRDAARDGRRNPAAAFAPQAPPLRGTAADTLRATAADALRATPGEVLAEARPTRLFERFERPVPSANPDPLDRRLARARDMAARARRTLDAAERPLDQARDAIPRDWQQRARDRIPGLGKDDHYVRESARKLSVLVGSIDEIGARADRLRGLARDMRELKQADEAGDEARRERALGRLQARRREA